MFFLQDIPVIHNGIFIYQLNIKSKQIDYFKSVKYNPTDEGYDLSFVSEKFDILDELKELNWRLHNYYLPQLDTLPDQVWLHFDCEKIEGIENQKVELYSSNSLIRRWVRSIENGRYIWKLVIPE
jgi:hypothetical protein